MATNMSVLNSAAAQGGTYQQYLQRLASGSGLEAQEARALLAGGMGSTAGNVKNSIANVLVNTGGKLTGNYGLAQGLGYDEYGQVAGGYGPQGLSDLSNIYQSAYGSAQGNSGGSYYGSGSNSNSATATQLAEYDQGIGQLEHGMGRLDTQLGIAIDNIAKQYGIKANELASSLAKGQNQYGTQTTQNQQDKRTNFNNINDRVSSGQS